MTGADLFVTKEPTGFGHLLSSTNPPRLPGIIFSGSFQIQPALHV
jgi:hypothetical protein